jgi:hypothetical protein
LSCATNSVDTVLYSKINCKGSMWVQKQRGRRKYEDIGKNNEETSPEKSPDEAKKSECYIKKIAFATA